MTVRKKLIDDTGVYICIFYYVWKDMPIENWCQTIDALKFRFAHVLRQITNFTYSPSLGFSESGGSFRTKVTVAPVCLGLNSTVMFHVGTSDDAALSNLNPLFTRALQ